MLMAENSNEHRLIEIKSSYFHPPDTRYQELARNLRIAAARPDGGELAIESNFVTPLSVVPLAHVMNQKQLTPKFARGSSVASYLTTVDFPRGAALVALAGVKGTYVPLMRVAIGGLPEGAATDAIEKLQDGYRQLISRNLIGDAEFVEMISENTFGFLLTELCANVSDHANTGEILLFAQYWQAHNCCEVCLVDNGRGWFRSLQGAGREVANSLDAVRKVIQQQLSAKSEEGGMVRGTGIRNTVNVLSNDVVQGEFSVLTGNAVYCKGAGKAEVFFEIPDFEWGGTIINIRVHKPARRVNIYDYVK